MAKATLLENDPENACFACGPANPRGLRLAFSRTDEGVETDFTPEAWQEGWPGTVHTGFLYIALADLMNWTIYAHRGRAGLPTRTGALETRRRVATGETLALTGRLVGEEDGLLLARADAHDAQGTLVASLGRAYDLPDREAMRIRLGYDPLPASVAALVPE